MKIKNFWKRFLGVVFVTALMSSISQPVSAQDPGPAEMGGWFNILWADAPDGSAPPPLYVFTDDNEQKSILLMDEALAAPLGGVLALDRRRITIRGTQQEASALTGGVSAILVESIALGEADLSATADSEIQSQAVTGSQAFVTIACKFSDVGATPKSVSYFQGMYSSSHPGLDYYWRQVSYDNINIVGSAAYGWYVLPYPRSYYVVDNYFNSFLASTTCAAAANADVNFANYTGINFMFNDDLDGYAWGGTEYMTLDGITKFWPMTWEPPWAYENSGVIAHEMGHAFGLPHSSGMYGEVYDNVWDVMSDHWTVCWETDANGDWVRNLNWDATYGCLGQHTISYHKDILGWIPAAQKYTAVFNTASTSTLERLALPQTGNYKIVQIPINGSNTYFYTVEVRKRAGYDTYLPSDAVIIHEVLTTREEPAHVVDFDGNGNTGDAGAMWTVGETFTDTTNNISVSVLSSTASGFQVRVTNGLPRPSAFNKIAPANNALSQLTNPTLSWESSSEVDSYEYCYSLTTTCSNWTSTNLNTSVTLSGLTAGATYYWQVRARNAYGETYANSGTLWKFKVGDKPAGFGKAAPASGVINQPRDISLSWNTSGGASYYEYCYDETAGATCDGSWVRTDLNTTATLSGLAIGRTYYWQARAVNVYGTTDANDGAYWSFHVGDKPAAFGKVNPLNRSTSQPQTPILKWTASSGITPTVYYEYCYDTTNDNACAVWLNAGLSTSAALSGLLPQTAYYWQARAVNNFGTTEANGGAWHSFTTAPIIARSFNSDAAQDGWVLETSENSSRGGLISASGKLLAGDDKANRQYRSLLSFNTAAMPDNAIISRVTVKLYKAGASVPDPFASLGDLVADIRKGSFGTRFLEAGDFIAAGEPINTAGKFAPAGGNWYQMPLNPAYFKYISLNGWTQFRIRFTLDDNNNKIQNIVQFNSGGDANGPQIFIEYIMP
jgi:M6 family metalloprotease-like protein